MSTLDKIIYTVLVVLIALKLFGALHWSWWWIVSPIWLPFVGAAGLCMIAGALSGLVIFLQKFIQNLRS